MVKNLPVQEMSGTQVPSLDREDPLEEGMVCEAHRETLALRLCPGCDFGHDGGAWKAAVHGVAEGRTRLSDFTFTFHFHALEKEMATHSSILA